VCVRMCVRLCVRACVRAFVGAFVRTSKGGGGGGGKCACLGVNCKRDLMTVSNCSFWLFHIMLTRFSWLFVSPVTIQVSQAR
jgi:hypothetical protein